MACPTPHKHAHATSKAAADHRNWIRKYRNGNVDLHVYRCGDHFHVGHSQFSFNRRIRAALRKNRS